MKGSEFWRGFWTGLCVTALALTGFLLGLVLTRPLRGQTATQPSRLAPNQIKGAVVVEQWRCTGSGTVPGGTGLGWDCGGFESFVKLKRSDGSVAGYFAVIDVPGLNPAGDPKFTVIP